jgi:hypothetical protein
MPLSGLPPPHLCACSKPEPVVYIYYIARREPVICKDRVGMPLTADFPKLAEKLSVIRTDRHEDLVGLKNILLVRKKPPKKFTVMCIMFSLAFLECFTRNRTKPPLILFELLTVSVTFCS